MKTLINLFEYYWGHVVPSGRTIAHDKGDFYLFAWRTIFILFKYLYRSRYVELNRFIGAVKCHWYIGPLRPISDFFIVCSKIHLYTIEVMQHHLVGQLPLDKGIFIYLLTVNSLFDLIIVPQPVRVT